MFLPVIAAAVAQEEKDVELEDLFAAGVVEVTDIHDAYFKLWQYDRGKPMILLFGSPDNDPPRELFYAPTPVASGLNQAAGDIALQDETLANSPGRTQSLMEGIEQLRQNLPIDQVIILDGEWGPSLGLAYVETYPELVGNFVVPVLPDWPENRIAVKQDTEVPPPSFDEWVKSLPFQVIGHPNQPSETGERKKGENTEHHHSVKDALIHAMTAIAVVFGF